MFMSLLYNSILIAVMQNSRCQYCLSSNVQLNVSLCPNTFPNLYCFPVEVNVYILYDG